MSFCDNCGHKLNGSGYCPLCGEENAPPTEMVVPDLDRIQARRLKVFPETKEEPKTTSKPKKSGRRLVVIAAIAVTVLVGVLLGLFLGGVFEKKKEQPAQQTAQPWEAMTVTIDGKQYSLPCRMQEFLDNGCQIVGEAKEETAGLITADGSRFEAILAEEGSKVVGICYLCAENVEFAGGVKLSELGSDEAIIEAFGDPDRCSAYGGCVYETENGAMELCCVDGVTDLSLYTAEALSLGYRPTEE